jgi:hypothetical protein
VTVGPKVPVKAAVVKPPCTPLTEPYIGAMKPESIYGGWKYCRE